MNDFINWSMLGTYSSFIPLVFLFVNFTKELPFIKKMPTKYYSFIISLSFLIIYNLYMVTFKFPDLFMYILSSILISTSSNGIADFNNSKKDTTIDNSTIKES